MPYETDPVERQLIVNCHHPLGVSTGFMWDSRNDWDQQILDASSVSPAAVELSALSENELPSLLSYLRSRPRLPFRFLSVHGPSKGRTLSENHLVDLLLEISELCDGIVMHPDTMGELAPFRRLGRKLVVENMDSRKGDGRTAEELEPVFDELPEARFCFDVAHAWSVDPTMRIAQDLLDAYSNRLSHVHLSSLSDDLHHITLRNQDIALFADSLRRCVDVPWILEAPPQTA